LNIDWIIPCRHVEVHDNLATIVGGGVDTFWPPEFPAPVGVAVAIRLLATVDELGEENKHTARNIVRAPDGSVLSDMSMEFAAGAEVARPDFLASLMLAGLIQFEASAEGTYAFEHIVDDSSKTIPLHVVQGPPPGAAPPAAE
jgi:hypothetical protein